MAHRTLLDPFEPSPVSADEFKRAFRHHPGGVAVLTGDDGSGPVAMTVSSVFSVSADPPALVCSLSGASSAAPHLLRAGSLVVHLLTPDTIDLALRAATHGANRFGDDVAWERLPTGEPVYTEVHTWLRGRIVEEVVIGDSTVIVVHVLETHQSGDAAAEHPLVYHNRRWAALTEDGIIEV